MYTINPPFFFFFQKNVRESIKTRKAMYHRKSFHSLSLKSKPSKSSYDLKRYAFLTFLIHFFNEFNTACVSCELI